MNKKLTSIFVVFSFFLTGASCDLNGSVFDTNEAPRETLPPLNMDDLVSSRDSDPSYDEGNATLIDLTGRSQTIRITEAGTYILEGHLTGSHIEVEAGDEDKIQLVLRGCSIECSNVPAIDIVNADKVFITLDNGTANTLSVTGSNDLNATQSAIHSKNDITLNGSGTLDITSSGNAIVCTDEVVITGGTYDIECEECAVQTKESVVITNADINISSCYDGLHTENEEDQTLGFVVITGGNIQIAAEDDCIHGTGTVTITGGDFDLRGSECIESTYVKIEAGTFLFYATGDGINAGRKSKAYYPTIEISGGDFNISIGPGDTDGIDSNGDLIITGGSFNISAVSPFDWDGELTLTGGTFIVNGEEVDTITNQIP